MLDELSSCFDATPVLFQLAMAQDLQSRLLDDVGKICAEWRQIQSIGGNMVELLRRAAESEVSRSGRCSVCYSLNVAEHFPVLIR